MRFSETWTLAALDCVDFLQGRRTFSSSSIDPCFFFELIFCFCCCHFNPKKKIRATLSCVEQAIGEIMMRSGALGCMPTGCGFGTRAAGSDGRVSRNGICYLLPRQTIRKLFGYGGLVGSTSPQLYFVSLLVLLLCSCSAAPAALPAE